MPVENQARRLAAIVAVDMVGYSRLMETDEAGTIVRQKAIQDTLIGPKVTEFGGRIFKTTGDGALIEFSSAVNAVRCAVGFQRAMADLEADVEADKRIAYRIGINLGDVIHQGDDVFGDGVNVASRLESLADPGGINISGAVFNHVKGKLDIGFADLGPQQAKNLSEPIPTFRVLLDPADRGRIITAKVPRRVRNRIFAAVFASVLLVILAAYFAWDSAGRAGLGDGRILIVPLKAENPGSRQLADAATEDLLRSFGRLKGIETVPYAISVAYKGIDVSLKDLSREIGARYILDGSAAADDAGVNISMRLRDARAAGDGVIWQQSQTGSQEQLSDLLAALKLGASGALKILLNPVEREIFETGPTTSPDAYLAFSEADRLLNSKDFTDIADALPLFEEAIRLDPTYVDARLGYATANFEIWQGSFNTIRYTLDARATATDIIQDILDKDPSNPQAIGLRVRMLIQQLDRDRALAVARAAVFSDPDKPGLRNVLGLSLTALGMYEEAIGEFAEYEALSPRLTSGEKGDLAWSYLRAGDSERALSLLLGIPDQELKEQHFRILANAHFQEGNVDAARMNLDKFMKNNVWLNLMWMKPWFEIYVDPAVYESFATAMLGAGLPELPYDFGKGREADRILRDELLVLYSGAFEEVHDTGPFGAPYREKRNPDGTITMSFAWMNGIDLKGTWYIKGDQFCHRLPAVHQGREECNNVYIDRERSSENLKYVSNVYSFGVFSSEFRRLSD